jgi:hypothetical protein
VRGLALFLLSVLALPANAECECIWQGSFSEVQGETDLVVTGRVVRARGNSIDVSVERRLDGGDTPEEVRVWLRTGDYCRPEPGLFPVDTEWVMALHRIDELVPGGFNPGTPNISFGRVGDYSLSSCGGYWLRLSDNWVTGNLVDAPRWAREPKMTPVLLDLVADYVAGNVDASVLLDASREDPAVRELMLDTRAFLRESR